MKYGLWDELQDDPDFINALLFGESYYRGITVKESRGQPINGAL